MEGLAEMRGLVRYINQSQLFGNSEQLGTILTTPKHKYGCFGKITKTFSLNQTKGGTNESGRIRNQNNGNTKQSSFEGSDSRRRKQLH